MFRTGLISLALLCAPGFAAQESAPAQSTTEAQPQYEDTFSGPIVELKPESITVTRTILGKPERRTFQIKPDTKIEGKLKVRVKVTVGFVTTDQGDIARLIVVRGQNTKK